MRGLSGKRDIFAGAVLIAIGLVAIFEVQGNTMGTLNHMGAAYFPVVLGAMLIALGGCIAATGLVRKTEDPLAEPFRAPDWRGCTAIVGGVVAFLVLGAYLGLAAGTFGCVFVSSLGDRTATWRQALVLAVAMTALAAGLFWYVLQVQFPLVKW